TRSVFVRQYRRLFCPLADHTNIRRLKRSQPDDFRSCGAEPSRAFAATAREKGHVRRPRPICILSFPKGPVCMKKITVLVALAWACQAQQKINTQPTVTELVLGAVRGVDKQQWTPPQLTLGDGVLPRRYAVRLKIVPSEETFSGTLDIEVDIKRSTSIIWLNGSELVVGEARLMRNGTNVAMAPVPGGEDFVGFASESPVKSGPATLHFTYSGKFSSRDSRGLFRQQDGNRWYVVSQFEPVHARRAFPCFDEPRFKVPWQLSIEIPGQLRAFSNTPVVAEHEWPDGFKVVEFAETKPLPSYLVALAVGPFEVVDAGSAGRKPTPIRIVTTEGKAAQARYAAQ